MKKMRILTHCALVASLLTMSRHALAESPPDHPADHWEVSATSGYLTKIRHNSPLDYAIVPSQILWRSPAMFDLWQGPDGARLTVRNRVALVAETFAKGPEDYYIAVAGSPTFELWSADRKTALFYEIGGGAGYLNSKGVPGGQGQNLAFNWFTQLGARHQMNKKFGLTGGLYFTHHSNLGMTDPNPGIDVLGLNVGAVWQLD
jgi:lipid A 3-O-deacylase